MSQHDGRTLPWRIFRRTVKPYAIAVSLSTFVVTYMVATATWPSSLPGSAA